MNFVLPFPIAVLSQYFFGTIIFLLSLFMVLLILVQRGKGGGLTGALGGPGGQSAFGTKAGDLFTRITIVAAAFWIFLLAFCTWWYTESDFTAALADDTVVGAGQMMAAPGDTGVTGAANSDSGLPAPMTPSAVGDTTAPAGDAPAAPSVQPSAEVDAGNMPKSSEAPASEAPAKEAGTSDTEPAKPTEPAKASDASTPAEKPESEAPKSEAPKTEAPSSDEPASPAKPPELSPPEPASSEPKLDSGAAPTPEK